MARRTRSKVTGQLLEPTPRADADWEVSTEWKAPTGRTLTPGMEFHVEGVRGRVKFIRHVRTGKGVEWVDAYLPGRQEHLTRAFKPERVRTVHTTAKKPSRRQAAA